MTRATALWMLSALTACGSAPPPTAASPATATALAPAPAPASAPPAPLPPPATGGSILFGDIASAKSFDPKATLLTIQDQLLACYNKERGAKAELRGKLKMRLVVNDVGTVVNAEPEQGGLSTEADLVACIGGAIRAAHFPKPGGMATVSVPMLFRP